MPRTETILRVFVASPADVNEERQLLAEVVNELNITWSKSLRIRLELVKWETHAYPGIGDDAQAVINAEVGADYDIFIGIMWTRFGSPTSRAESGTKEEFEMAYSRYKADPNGIRIMFYFKDEPVAPSEMAPDQLLAIANFKKQLGERGTLFWTYKDRDEFSSLLRLHLSRQVQTWIQDTMPNRAILQIESPTARDSHDNSPMPDSQEEDEGFLDLFERSTDHFLRGMEILSKMGTEVQSLGEKIGGHTAEYYN